MTFLNTHTHPVLFPPLLFGALVLTLWAQKCVMMVLFQNKIIYMPSLPPFSRQEKIEDYVGKRDAVTWEKRHIKSMDGTRLALCLGQTARKHLDKAPSNHVVILYFQGWVALIAKHNGYD